MRRFLIFFLNGLSKTNYFIKLVIWWLDWRPTLPGRIVLNVLQSNALCSYVLLKDHNGNNQKCISLFINVCFNFSLMLGPFFAESILNKINKKINIILKADESFFILAWWLIANPQKQQKKQFSRHTVTHFNTGPLPVPSRILILAPLVWPLPHIWLAGMPKKGFFYERIFQKIVQSWI